MVWSVFAASAMGKDHIGLGLPCQDDFAFRIVGDVFIGVVCDGAGSAAHSEIGAKACSQSVVESIANVLLEPATGSIDLACERSTIESAVDNARSLLQLLADENTYQFRDLSCTLVGAISSPGGGCFFHIGDGFAAAEFEGATPVVSLPENGEYANETYFVTATEWQEHLRITPLPSTQLGHIALMSDGAAPFVINREKNGLSAPFINPVTKYLSDKSYEDGCKGLYDTLADERTYAITGDDKTLLIAMLK